MGARFQDRVWRWMVSCFGSVIPGDKIERGDRLIEEVFELLQASSYPEERVDALKRYVYDRPVGELFQETGGVMVTLAAFSQAHDIDMYEAGETELERVWTKIEQIRAKQAAKPVGSALPVSPPYSEGQGWLDIDDRAMSEQRVLLLWKPDFGLGEHVELGRYCKIKKVWLNTYDHSFRKAPDKWAPLVPFFMSQESQTLLERLQAIIDWCDLATKNRKEFDSHGVRLLDGPVFDAAREVLSAYGQGGAA